VTCWRSEWPHRPWSTGCQRNDAGQSDHAGRGRSGKTVYNDQSTLSNVNVHRAGNMRSSIPMTIEFYAFHKIYAIDSQRCAEAGSMIGVHCIPQKTDMAAGIDYRGGCRAGDPGRGSEGQ
jgi:hypothetical protein